MRSEETRASTHIRTQDGASDTSMKGKTVLFTGASRGMGRFAAIEFARRGAEILELDPPLGGTRTWKLGQWRFIKRDEEE